MASPVVKDMDALSSPPKEELITDSIGAGFYSELSLSSNNYTMTSRSEIEEEIDEDEEENSRDLFEIKRMAPIKEEYEESSLFSFEVGPNGENHVVYVCVSKTNYDESMDALVWTLNNIVNRSDDPKSSTVVYLIHVFPELRYLPTPLGKLPISQANPEQKESFMIQERIKRREFLQKFLHLCSTSKVRVETILIESDMEAKAILDLIPILYVRRLVLGTSKSTLRRIRSKRGSRTVDQILQNAPEFCEVKIICEGKEVIEEQLMIESPSPSPRASVSSPKVTQLQDHNKNDTFTCCFKPKAES